MNFQPSNENIEPTISREDLNIEWDAVIIGAGPAGALVACHLAGPTSKILLLDKAHFPRAKVCGCCLNSAAEETLRRAGLVSIFTQSQAVPLQTLELHNGAQSSLVNLLSGHALSRNFMDAYLIKQAILRGAYFLPGMAAKVGAEQGEFAQIDISATDYAATMNAKLVIVADGLGGQALSHLPAFTAEVEKNARFGCGTILGGNGEIYRPGRIYMCCHHSGYAGLVVLEDGRIDVAAALDRSFSRLMGGPANAVAAILESCRLPLPPGLKESHWQGTDSLTQKRNCLAAARIFVVGDSCGYAEPFTGEGMAWALQSAEAVIPLAQKAISSWHHSLIQDWQAKHANLLAGRQQRSKLIAHALRNDLLRTTAFPLISSFPILADKVMASIGQTDIGKVRQ